MNALLLLLLGLALILANGFFVAVEFSLMAARRGLIEERAEAGSMGARRALEGMRNLNVQLAASQLGISVVSLLLGWLIEPVIGSAFERLFGMTALPESVSKALGLAIGLIIIALVHMVVGEMVPKSLALSAPEAVAVALAPAHRLVVVVVRPAVAGLYWLARLGTQALGVEPTDELAQAHTAPELAVMVAESRAGGELQLTEHELLVGALGFLHIRVAEVMAPRQQLVTVPYTATVAQAEELVHRSGHSRVLVLGSVPDQVTGFLHAKDLIAVAPEKRNGLLPPGIVRVALSVKSEDRLEELMQKMRRTRRHVAVVMDQGHLLGLVTLEDILEAIVGEISDESDGGSGQHVGLPPANNPSEAHRSELGDSAREEQA
ncbi:MAG: hemolysin family protein [Actinomycetes bacterium]